MEQAFVPSNVSAAEVAAPAVAADPDDLAAAAAELAALVDHHRQELIDAMAELTRLQRVLRSEVRAAIEAIETASAVVREGDADPAVAP